MDNENYKTRAYIELDAGKEADLVRSINQLIAKKKLSKYLSNLLRYVNEHEEVIQAMNNECSNSELMYGNSILQKNRNEFISSIKEVMDKQRSILSKIVDETVKLKSSVATASRIGVEKDLDAIIVAEMIVGNNFKRMSNVLGIDIDIEKSIDVKNKFKDVQSIADEFTEYLINYLDSKGYVVVKKSDINNKAKEEKGDFDNSIQFMMNKISELQSTVLELKMGNSSMSVDNKVNNNIDTVNEIENEKVQDFGSVTEENNSGNTVNESIDAGVVNNIDKTVNDDPLGLMSLTEENVFAEENTVIDEDDDKLSLLKRFCNL